MSERQRGQGKKIVQEQKIWKEKPEMKYDIIFFLQRRHLYPILYFFGLTYIFSSNPSSLALMLPCPLFCGRYIWLITSHIYTREIPARIIFLYEFCGHLYRKMKEQTFNHGRLGFCGPNGIGHLDVYGMDGEDRVFFTAE